MNKKFIGAVFVASVLVGCSIGWLVYYQNDVASQQVVFSFFNKEPNPKTPKPSNDNWLDNVKNFNKSYLYPAREFDVFIDFVDPDIKTIPQKLFIGSVDNYLFYCLNELFKARDIDFAYSKNSNSIDLIVYLPKEYTKAQGLIKELKYYEIPYVFQ